ncbi:hypothetical protein CVT25_005812 [Psilocybe cyanescens]|uniref:J domain-containing protein n=1 Tax=Psilocybe cyanescens TaxID=93625 RepID=A0A409VV71_PSICY|nr:hypothetical protein CVT25_005812 [Psilocybe cyanescens]
MGAAGSKAEPDTEPTSKQPTSTTYEGLDFYEILCISRGATNEEIKRAYYTRAKYTHPDKDSTLGAKERFQKLNEAYERRARYDIELENEADSETKTDPEATTSMPGQWGAQAAQTRSPGWFEWLFHGFPWPGDPLLRYVPATYISRNQHLVRPQGISAKEIHEYLTACITKATWEENGRDPGLCTLLRNLFECIAYDEKRWGAHNHIPDFGYVNSLWCREDGNAQHYAQEFYTFWLNFETRKPFDWINPYYTTIDDPALLRKVAKENNKVHKAAKDQYNDVIRTIVQLLLSGDPRVMEHLVLSYYRGGKVLTAEEFCSRFIRQYQQKNKVPREHPREHPPEHTREHTQNNQNNGERHRTQTKNQRKKQKQRNRAKQKNSCKGPRYRGNAEISNEIRPKIIDPSLRRLDARTQGRVLKTDMQPHTLFIPLFLLNLAFGYASAAAEPATLYHITAADPSITSLPYSLIQSGTTLVRAIGTGADGKTTYVQDSVVSLLAAQYPAANGAQPSVETLISAPLTIPVTFAEDKSGYHATRSLSVLSPSGSQLAYQAGLDEKCVFNADGTGTCVRVDIHLDANTQTTFSTTTYSDLLDPWHTVDDAGGASPSVTGNSARGTATMKDGSALGMLGIMMGVSISLLSGLGLLGFGIW